MSDELPNLNETRASEDRRPTDRQNGQGDQQKSWFRAFPPTINPLGSPPSLPFPPLPMTKSPLSRHPSQSPEDWDHPESSMVDPSASASPVVTSTNRVVFPSQGGAATGAGATADPDTPTPEHSHRGGRAGKRTLSELLKLHAEKGTDVHFTSEEANRLEELLGQWVRPVLFFLFVFRSHDGFG